MCCAIASCRVCSVVQVVGMGRMDKQGMVERQADMAITRGKMHKGLLGSRSDYL